MNIVEIEAQCLHYGIAAGVVSFWLFHLVGWITGVARSTFNNRL